jgi:uncharacterized protein
MATSKKRAKRALRAAGAGELGTLISMAEAEGCEGHPPAILVCTDADECQPMHRAAAAGHTAVVRYLLSAKADADCRKSKSKTPLHEAAAAGHTEVIQLLLESGALISAHKTNGWTPLMYSCSLGDWTGASLLLQYGANLRDRNRDGQTGFYLACREGHAELVTRLLDPETPLPDVGNTPYALSASETETETGSDDEPSHPRLLEMRTRNMKTALHGNLTPNTPSIPAIHP